MSWDVVCLGVLLGGISAGIARDAWLDRTPRVGQVWWAYRRSAKERQAHRMRVRPKKAA